jgi:hypothetical protein
MTDNNYGMFTQMGNMVVGRLVDRRVAMWQDTTREDAFNAIYKSLGHLQEVDGFSEALDTEVRERVWAALCERFPD